MDGLLVETVEFRVIGELKSDPRHLLLEGDDGRWYDYDIALGTVAPIEPSDAWAVDAREIKALQLGASTSKEVA